LSLVPELNRYESFRQMHHQEAPLLLPNAWDFITAALLSQAGHQVIGTTSLGVAAAAGKPDAVAATRSETVAVARTLATLPVLITVDIENGFSDDPAEVADVAAELAAAGAVGVNLEDGQPDGLLTPIELQSAKIREIKRRVPELFINARTDTYWLSTSPADPLAETLRRGAAFAEAGADGFFVPGAMPLQTIGHIAQQVPLPLNVLHRPGIFNRSVLAEFGIARVSTGSLLFRLALDTVVQASLELNTELRWPDGAGPLSYAEVQQILIQFADQTAAPTRTGTGGDHKKALLNAARDRPEPTSGCTAG
jgi:2-methylisocitrate lyase-like PEP mutase family enzyme